ncbi:MAG: hypothetical protein V3V12_00630 [Gammaproteobacteria bacterium]
MSQPAILNSASQGLTDECLGFGFLRRSTSCIPADTQWTEKMQAVVRPHQIDRLACVCCKRLA